MRLSPVMCSPTTSIVELALSNCELSAYRGRTIAMIFQEPGLALDPVYRLGDQKTCFPS
jgi:ABC-type dipeptide/oligopeptide/nickel transport system ATPase component